MIYSLTLNPALDKEYRVPDLALDSVLRSSSLNVDFGGKGFNIARMLAAFGEKSIALGFVGGHAGQVLENGLSGLRIKTEFVHVAGETRTNVSIVSRKSKRYIKVNEPGPVISAEESSQLLEKIEASVRTGDWWVLAGSLPPGMPADSYARIIELLNARGAKAILDTSGEALRLGCAAGPYLIKPNLEEMAQLTGTTLEGEAEIEAALASVHAMGVAHIVLSAGEGRSVWSAGARKWQAIPPSIELGNPTGAGDAMLAGIVYRLHAGAPTEEAFAWGVASGSAAASMPGTRMPQRSAVEQFLKEVVVKEVDYVV